MNNKENTEQEKVQHQAMPAMSRSQKRRMYNQFGLLKKKNWLTEEGRELYARLKQEGDDAHTAHVNRVNDEISDKLQTILDSVKETWTESGYDKKEIKLLEEAWLMLTIKNKETYREDRKEARRLMKEANNLKAERLNADNNS